MYIQDVLCLLDLTLHKNYKKRDNINVISLMPAAGLEPARGHPQQILSLPRLPFRHAGIRHS